LTVTIIIIIIIDRRNNKKENEKKNILEKDQEIRQNNKDRYYFQHGILNSELEVCKSFYAISPFP